MRDTVDSLIERALGRPRLVRDRVLLATSDDGLTWRKDERVHITHPSHRRPHMTYYTAEDPAGRLWVRASVYDGGWHTELGRGRRWIDVRPLGVDHLYSPCWDGRRLYGVDRAPVCFACDEDYEPVERVDQRWERIGDFPAVLDLWVTRVDDGSLAAFVTAGAAEGDLAIHRWVSGDGASWAYAGPVLASPFAGRFRVASNPCVVSLGEAGGWRMYFRTGERVVLGNSIRSAVSDDLETWRHEQGDRVAPGGRWDRHGVGFPRVWREDGGWRMYYAGYWGATRRAAATEERWRELRPA